MSTQRRRRPADEAVGCAGDASCHSFNALLAATIVLRTRKPVQTPGWGPGSRDVEWVAGWWCDAIGS
jgi:hypothetical protein